MTMRSSRKSSSAPLVKAWVLQPSAEALRKFGFEHPLGESWRGYQDINPAVLPRERILDMLKKTNVEAIRKIIPCGTPKEVARRLKGFARRRHAGGEDHGLWRHGRIEDLPRARRRRCAKRRMS